MVSTIILTHGGLADELLAAAGEILGRDSDFHAVTLDWNDSFEEAREKLGRTLAELDDGSGEVLIFTDIHGGTPYNVAASFHEPGRVEVVTGVNLPMVVRLGCPGVSQMEVGELADWIQQKGRTSICRAGHNGAPEASGNSR